MSGIHLTGRSSIIQNSSCPLFLYVLRQYKTHGMQEGNQYFLVNYFDFVCY